MAYLNNINAYTDQSGNCPYAKWLANLPDPKAKAYWRDHKRRHKDGT